MKNEYFERLPEEGKTAISNLAEWMAKFADMKIIMDDQFIQDWLRVNGLPEKREWDGQYAEGGGGMITYCDGRRSFIVAGWSNNPDPVDNGYAMISFLADPVREATVGRPDHLAGIMASLCIILGFDHKKAIDSMRLMPLMDTTKN